MRAQSIRVPQVTDGDGGLVATLAPRVQRTLVARYGVNVGADAAAEAMAWAVENSDRLAGMANPAGYLYRVGQSAARRIRRVDRGRVAFPQERASVEAPGLPGDVFAQLSRLRHEQRVAVLLVHGYRFTYAEVAELLCTNE